MTILPTAIVLKYDTAENWKQTNPFLLKGEVAIEFDNNITGIKVGNGVDNFNDLPYVASSEWLNIIKTLKRTVCLFMIMNMILVLFILYLLL